jgi:hypothetical protein
MYCLRWHQFTQKSNNLVQYWTLLWLEGIISERVEVFA